MHVFYIYVTWRCATGGTILTKSLEPFQMKCHSQIVLEIEVPQVVDSRIV